ncbi:MAG: hypothetical protein F9K23_17015 [Bacteroidetes bacterium]|nr:MAG: hypothetical protein F9K23_17015 [Bacteroidota bacterium]
MRFIPIADIRPPKNTFVLKGDLGKLLGKLEPYRLAITLEGDQGAGKTQLAFQLADAFAETGRTVLFYSLEIGANSDIIVCNRKDHLSPRNIPKVTVTEESTLKDVREGARLFDVVIIDSWTKLDVDSSEFDKLRKDYPDTIFIVLFQRTASNKIRGGTKPLYDAGINIEVVKADNTFVNNYAVATKNRYGQTGLQYNVSEKVLQ